MAQSAGARGVGPSLVRERVQERPNDVLESLADDPTFLEALDDLDRGVFGFYDDGRTVLKRRPLMAQLVVPCAPAPRPAGLISAWAASWIMLAMLAGASAAGYVFRGQLSQIVDRWERTGKDNTGSGVLTALARSVQ